jgi:hypothetical protein
MKTATNMIQLDIIVRCLMYPNTIRIMVFNIEFYIYMYKCDCNNKASEIELTTMIDHLFTVQLNEVEIIYR